MGIQPCQLRGLSFHRNPTSLARLSNLASAHKSLSNRMDVDLFHSAGCCIRVGRELDLEALFMKLKTVATKNATFNVLDEGKGLPILFAHGFPLDHSMWRFQLEPFAKSNRVICPDLPGFGKSTFNANTDNPISMRSFADSLADLLNAIEVDQPIVLCGLSMGGYVGWQFWKHHHERLAALVACNTRAASDTEQVGRARKISAESVRETGAASVADAMIPKVFFQTEKEIAHQTHSVISKTDPESIATGQIAMSLRPDATPWLSDIEIPCLFVAGQHDEITTPTEMRENSELVPNSTFVEIAGAGHMSPLECPGEFNQTLNAFLKCNEKIHT